MKVVFRSVTSIQVPRFWCSFPFTSWCVSLRVLIMKLPVIAVSCLNLPALPVQQAGAEVRRFGTQAWAASTPKADPTSGGDPGRTTGIGKKVGWRVFIGFPALVKKYPNFDSSTMCFYQRLFGVLLPGLLRLELRWRNKLEQARLPVLPLRQAGMILPARRSPKDVVWRCRGPVGSQVWLRHGERSRRPRRRKVK